MEAKSEVPGVGHDEEKAKVAAKSEDPRTGNACPLSPGSLSPAASPGSSQLRITPFFASPAEDPALPSPSPAASPGSNQPSSNEVVFPPAYKAPALTAEEVRDGTVYGESVMALKLYSPAAFANEVLGHEPSMDLKGITRAYRNTLRYLMVAYRESLPDVANAAKSSLHEKHLNRKVQRAVDQKKVQLAKDAGKECEAAPGVAVDKIQDGPVTGEKRKVPETPRPGKVGTKRKAGAPQNCRQGRQGLHVSPPPPGHPPRLPQGMPEDKRNAFLKQIINITERAVHTFVVRQPVPKAEIAAFLGTERERGQARTATTSFVDWDLRLHLKFLIRFSSRLCTEHSSAFAGTKRAAPQDVVKAVKGIADKILAHGSVEGRFDDGDLLVVWSAIIDLVELVGGDRTTLARIFHEIITEVASHKVTECATPPLSEKNA